jgi:hypothetical protein
MTRHVAKTVGFLVVVFLGLAGCGGGGSTSTAQQSNSGGGGSTSTAQQSNSNNTASSYFPLTVGSKWSYKYTAGVSTRTIDKEVTSAGKIKETDGSTVYYYNYTVSDTGVYSPQNEVSGIPSDSRTYTTLNSPSRLRIPGNLSSGAVQSQTYTTTSTSVDSSNGNVVSYPSSTYTEAYTVIGTESVTVPAGTFNALKIKSSSASSATQYNWYSYNVGLIKSTTDGVDSVLELASYSIK